MRRRISPGSIILFLFLWMESMQILFVSGFANLPRGCFSAVRRRILPTSPHFLSMSTDDSVDSSATRTLAPGSHWTEFEVKKSRFLAYASHVDSWQDAQDYISTVKLEHPKARHWCIGYCGGVNPVTERCSDDGEPTGTAGLPILGAIHGESLSDTVCVVVRYFGGIKLGAGGLIRAYGGSARQTLREAPVEILIPKSTLRVNVLGSFVGVIYEVAAKVGGVISQEEYGADGSLSISITCETSDEQHVRDSLKDSTRGNAVFIDD
jgi:uncharacterized YigZ family protein